MSAAVRILRRHDDTCAFEFIESLDEHRPRHRRDPFRKRREGVRTEHQIAHNQRIPPLGEYLRRAGNRTVLAVRAHPLIVPPRGRDGSSKFELHRSVFGADHRIMGTESTDNASTGQVSTTAAEVYEEFFVPALFAQWVGPMLDAVDAQLGDQVLDVGTGTGVLARAALQRVGSAGSVIAVDPNEGMLTVAARLTPRLDIRCGVAEQLPVSDGEMTCTTCQFALMLLEDRPAPSAR